MIFLVSLQTAKEHLRIVDDDSDSDIEAKLAAASAIVMRHHKLESVPAEWFDAAFSPPQIVPPDNISAAVLLVMSELFENRESSVSNPLSESVKSLIPRDPTLA